jgi:AhpD family alkylhydroperoxidase
MSSEHAMSSEQTTFTDHSLFTEHTTFTEHSLFAEHTIESAPAAARRAMTATENRLGYLPSAIARMATSPDLLDGFLKLSGMFEATTLDPIAREVLIMTIATRNGCHLCVAMHTARLTAMNADAALIAALREGAAAPDPRLDAIRVFTLRVLETSGDVGDSALKTFLAHGYTEQNALEVVLGTGAYTMVTLANRLTGAPVDGALRQFA